MAFRPIDPKEFPTEWSDGDYLVGMRLFGLFPFGRQHIVISRSPSTTDTYAIRDNGHGDMIRKWDHHITIRSDPTGTHYTDDIQIEAGLLTPFVWLWAEVFYRWRQYRWRQLVQNEFGYGKEAAW